MRFKPFAVASALALAATSVVLTQAGAQATADLEVEQANDKVTVLAGGCDTGTVTFTFVNPDGTASDIDATSVGSGRYSHEIALTSDSAPGNYSVEGTCKAGSDTLVTYNKKYYTIDASSLPEASTDDTSTDSGTEEVTPDGELTASVGTVAIGKSAVVTMTNCPDGDPAEGDSYRATFEVTSPLGIKDVSNSDYTDSSTHEMVFSTDGTTQPGDYTIDGRCEKKAGDAWSEVRTYKAATIKVDGVAEAQATATPAPTAAGNDAATAIGFTG